MEIYGGNLEQTIRHFWTCGKTWRYVVSCLVGLGVETCRVPRGPSCLTCLASQLSRCEGCPTCWVDGGGLPGLSCCPGHAYPQRVRGCRGGRERGGWKEHGSMFPACRGQPVFQTSRSRPASPTRHVTSPLSARSTRLRSLVCLSDTLPLCGSRF